MAVTAQFHVTNKSETAGPDGATRYEAILVCTTEGTTGMLAFATDDSEVDSFFEVDGVYTATFAVDL